MGILNVTPDSFSDSGQYFDTEAAVNRGLELLAQGAEILDIGGESTRPGATPVPEAEELRRVMPVLEALAQKATIPLSIDTLKAGVAQAALKAGAAIVNDVGANREDPRMWEVAAEAGAGYVCMHMQGTPQTMQIAPRYADVVQEVHQFLAERMTRLNRCGIGREQIILDPGIGFGKTMEHNLQLLGNLGRFAHLGRPMLLGVSRKSFLAKVLGDARGTRLPAGLACACSAVQMGVQIIRTHDVAESVQAIRMAEAILARRKNRGAELT